MDPIEDRIAARRARRNHAERSAELQAEWDAVLSAEGLHPEPLPKQIRGPRGTPERDKPKAREIPLEPPGRSQYKETVGGGETGMLGGLWVLGTRIHDHPETELQALMETAPGDQPRSSTQGMERLRDVIVDAIEELPEPTRTAMLLWTGGTPMSEIGQELGCSKAKVHKLIAAARDTLAKQLKDHPEVVDHLEEM